MLQLLRWFLWLSFSLVAIQLPSLPGAQRLHVSCLLPAPPLGVAGCISSLAGSLLHPPTLHPLDCCLVYQEVRGFLLYEGPRVVKLRNKK